MCAIIDANVSHEVFGSNRPEAGVKFFEWLNTGKGLLVVGGKLLVELENSSPGFREWAKQAQSAGRMRSANEDDVKTKTEAIWSEGVCRSDDPHILALAQVSGARLLYSNDGALQEDFGTKSLLDNPRGKVYTTTENRDFRETHKKLLSRKDLCRAKQ